MPDGNKDSGTPRTKRQRTGLDETMEYLTPADFILDPDSERQIAQMRRARLRKQGLTDREIDAAYGPEGTPD